MNYERRNQYMQGQEVDVELTQEERQILMNCFTKEALWNGGVPGAILGAILGRIISTGMKIPGPRYYLPPLLGLSGYVMGRAYYGFSCLQKVPRIANMNDKERVQVLRSLSMSHRRQERYTPDNSRTVDVPQQHKLDNYSGVMDSEPAQPMSDYDGFHSFDTDDDTSKQVRPQRNTTYDELRQKNRQEFYSAARQSDHVQRSWRPAPPPPPPVQPEVPKTSLPSGKKTKYGDDWD